MERLMFRTVGQVSGGIPSPYQIFESATKIAASYATMTDQDCVCGARGHRGAIYINIRNRFSAIFFIIVVIYCTDTAMLLA